VAGRLYSMTGFGAAQGTLSERLAAAVRLTSINARFLELSVRSQPRIDTMELEPALRAALGKAIGRGRVAVGLQFQATAMQGTGVALRWEVAESLLAELERRPAGLELAPLSLRDLLAVPGFVEGGGELVLGEDERDALLALVESARDDLAASRAREAAALLPQIESEIALLAAFCDWLATVNREVAAAVLVRLRARLAELLGGVTPPDERLLVEAALVADRADVSEEIERLRAHLAELRRLLDAGGVVGKKLDFLVQELLREVNTAGSKCREAGMGDRIVEAKAAIEKLREQFANLE
jgi:uncharacterized protein (TIGR00255 family)